MARIEIKTHQKVPDNICYVVSETIKINKKELEELINIDAKGMIN